MILPNIRLAPDEIVGRLRDQSLEPASGSSSSVEVEGVSQQVVDASAAERASAFISAGNITLDGVTRSSACSHYVALSIHVSCNYSPARVARVRLQAGATNYWLQSKLLACVGIVAQTSYKPNLAA